MPYTGRILADFVYPESLWPRLRARDALRLRLRTRARGEGEWRELRARPIVLRGERYWQFVYAHPRHDHTENLSLAAAEVRLREHLSMKLRSLVWEGHEERIIVQFSRKGRPQLRRETRGAPVAPPSLTHDEMVDLPLPAERADPFLIALGVMTDKGRIRAHQRAKFRQINGFLRHLEHARAGEESWGVGGRPLRLLDCACGAATLSFAVKHYLSTKYELLTELTAIDENTDIVAKAQALARRLGWEDSRFQVAAIRAFQPTAPPDILLALHACDTATDEALALGIRSGARFILAAPCCHHHLQRQMQPIAPFGFLRRKGILKQRLGDWLTDSLRALALETMGYRCAVVEFIGSEHTDRNLLLRARLHEASDGMAELLAAREYRQLRDFWGLQPHLETLLGKEFQERLNDGR